MKQIKKFKNSFKYFIPWDLQTNEEGIILTKYNKGGFQATIEIRNYDLDYYPEEAIKVVVKKLNNIYKRLPDGWSFHYEVQRRRTQSYITKELSDKPLVTRIIDKIRENSFKNKKFFETRYFITLSYVIFEELDKSVDKFFKNKKISNNDVENTREIMEQYMKEFKKTLNSVIESLKAVSIEVKLLKDAELMRFLYSTINSEWKDNLKLPPKQYFLDEYLSNSNFEDGIDAKINDKYLKTISLSVFPDTAMPRVFQKLETLDFEFRYVTRFIVLTKKEAIKILETFREYHKGKSRKAGQWFKEILTQQETLNVDTVSLGKSAEANSAIADLRSGFVSYGFYTFTFIITDTDLKRLNDNCMKVKQKLEDLGFSANIENFNTMDSYIGAIPGNVVMNIRKMPINTALLSYLIPISSIFSGEKRNKHLKDIPLLIAKTGKKDLFNLNLHVADTGHTLMIGRTGGGKSAMLGAIGCQYMKYPNAKVIIFDKKASSMVLTHLVGGDFYDLGNNELSFQPLARVDEYKEMVFANDWIIGILEQENVKLDSLKKRAVWDALNILAENDPKRRTMEIFSIHCQNDEIREALRPYTKLGSYGQYFDNDNDNVKDSKWQVFEMESVIDIPKVCEPLMDYLFHRIETDLLNGDPVLLILDECWLLLKNPKMKNKIEEWLRVLRSKNGVVLFATQSLDEIDKSDIASVIIDSCKTKLFLSNPQAATKDKRLYEILGLNDREIITISEAEEKKDYFYVSELGSRLFQMRLSEEEVILVGATDKKEHELIKRIKAKNNNTKDIIIDWIDHKREGNEISVKAYDNLKEIIGGFYENK